MELGVLDAAGSAVSDEARVRRNISRVVVDVERVDVGTWQAISGGVAVLVHRGVHFGLRDLVGRQVLHLHMRGEELGRAHVSAHRGDGLVVLRDGVDCGHVGGKCVLYGLRLVCQLVVVLLGIHSVVFASVSFKFMRVLELLVSGTLLSTFDREVLRLGGVQDSLHLALTVG